MDTQEIDSTLDELENRLDRLRALYEQYFLGIEKIEPAVARKDVDRRFWLLRRTQIRNTARRWRLQVLIQRYNTFQQYWTRICREIDNGTYARHLLKAKKNLGAEPITWAAKKRMGLLRRGHVGEPSPAADENVPISDEGGLSNGDVMAAREELSSVAADTLERVRPAATPQRGAVITLTLDDLGPLDLDLEDEPGPPPPPPRTAAMPVGRPPSATKVNVGETSTVPQPGSGSPRPPLPKAAAPIGAVRVAMKPEPVAPPLPPRVPPPVPSASRAVAAGRPPVPRATATGIAGPPARAASPASGAAAMPNPPAPKALHGSKPASPFATSEATGGAKGGAGVSDERVRKLHAELVETKRKLNLGDAVSLDALARSLRDTESKLRAQHVGRTVDFQIIVKDGKPVVKPVVRK